MRDPRALLSALATLSSARVVPPFPHNTRSPPVPACLDHRVTRTPAAASKARRTAPNARSRACASAVLSVSTHARLLHCLLHGLPGRAGGRRLLSRGLLHCVLRARLSSLHRMGTPRFTTQGLGNVNCLQDDDTAEKLTLGCRAPSLLVLNTTCMRLLATRRSRWCI